MKCLATHKKVHRDDEKQIHILAQATRVDEHHKQQKTHIDVRHNVLDRVEDWSENRLKLRVQLRTENLKGSKLKQDECNKEHLNDTLVRTDGFANFGRNFIKHFIHS